MTQTVGEQAREDRLSQQLGFGLLLTAWRLFLAHWWELVAVAACAYVAHHYLMEAAVWVGGRGDVPGLLVFSLVPLVPLIATVMMLLLLRRHEHRAGAGAITAGIASVLVPFLVVYESQGAFLQDIGTYFDLGFWEDWNALDLTDVDSEVNNRLPSATSPLVLGVVIAAFLLRAIGSRVAQRDVLWEKSTGRQRLRTALRVSMGYAEVVWIVLGAVVVNAGIAGLNRWWLERRLGRGLIEWWQALKVSLPDLGAVGDWLVNAVAIVLDGAVTGLVAPLAWLAIGVVIYGLSAVEGIQEEDVVTAVANRQRIGAVTRRVNPVVITTAWRRIADPEGRFGALLGGAAMILRSRFLAVITFCAVYTVVVTATPYVIWEIARAAGAELAYVDWVAAYTPIAAVAYIIGLCLTAPLLAAFADALLIRFGATSQLRLRQGISSSM